MKTNQELEEIVNGLINKLEELDKDITDLSIEVQELRDIIEK